MRTKNKPVFISLARRFRPIAENVPAQRDSGISKLGVGVLGILRSLGVLGGKTKNKNSPAQRDSKMSNLVWLEKKRSSSTRLRNIYFEKLSIPSMLSISSIGFENQPRSTAL